MTTNKGQKLKCLLDIHKADTVLLAPYLESCGISRDLQQHYIKNGWLARVGNGAFKRPGDVLDWQGIVYAFQSEVVFPVHVGALTALSMHGYAHYIRHDGEPVTLFSGRKRSFPSWTKEQECFQSVSFHYTSFIRRDDLGLIKVPHKSFELVLSAPERAILETLYLTPGKADLVEAYQVMESLTTLNPSLLQPLLEACQSVKVKRLFMLMATKADHAWVKHLDSASFGLGSGVRSLNGGVYVPEYKITVPKELANLWN
jgi:hypothetical protein